jgi:hypothetical protein
MFSYATTTNHLLKRNLADYTKIILLIGFSDYKDNSEDKRTFNIHLKYEAREFYSNVYFVTSVIYQNHNKRDNVPVNCTYATNFDSHYLTYNCVIDNGNNITNISLNNYELKLSNSSGYNYTFTKNQIILSTLANSTIKNIEKEKDKNFLVFYLLNKPIIKKNGVELNGKIIYKNNDIPNNFTFDLSLPDKVICNYSYSEKNLDKIIFSPKTDVNIHLNAMVGQKISYYYHIDSYYYSNDYILILNNNTDDFDLVLYSNDKYSYIELLGFKDYKKLNSNIATAKAVLKGTLYSLSTLKNNFTFTAKTNNGTNITATGKKNSEVQNNTLTYNVTFYIHQSNDEPNTFYKDFVFYDSDIKEGIEQINVYPEDLLIRNEDWTKIKEILFPSKPKEVYNGLNFDFDNPNEFKDYTFERLANAYMSYIPLNENLREKIKCTFKNNTDSYNLICHPDKSFITYMNTLRISVEGIRKSRRLRFLQTKENITFSSPLNSTELIDYTYDPDFNTFAKKVSKDKGLSAGAIVAIVLSCIAVVAAIGVAIFFLNRKPANPVKYVNNNNSYFQNSTAEINKQ